ncbi:MAG: ATP-binding cassette domain-containing protein [Cyclobacteriaceae bacterium]|nr:ATP-binding cassette domain-containing protein [Cyclobacteriaceae bacterium]MCH8515366.1 ATP-binding cassette domain-containing protein [Cyclobacteriaceae bacterium]
MKLKVDHLGKKFLKRWVFKNISFETDTNEAVAIIGSNGSGKSTFLQIIIGFILASKGSRKLIDQKGNVLNEEEIIPLLSFCSPLLEMPAELKVSELWDAHFKLKQIEPTKNFREIPGLDRAGNLKVKELSSGMYQKLKLGLALYADLPILILDEPSMHLDREAKIWYKNTLTKEHNKKLILIGSNEEFEYDFCTSHIKMEILL